MLLSRIACVPTLPQPTSMLPLPPTASPVGEHDEMPMVPKSIVRRTVPVVLISATPPGLLVPANAGIETKNVPVVRIPCRLLHAAGRDPPLVCGDGDRGLAVRATGGCPFVVEKRFPYAGVSALLAARTCSVEGEKAISSTRVVPPVEIDCMASSAQRDWSR